MASGASNPVANTAAPRRVTSRSSWITTRRPRSRRAIFKRTELAPMSTAAKTAMRRRLYAGSMKMRLAGGTATSTVQRQNPTADDADPTDQDKSESERLFSDESMCGYFAELH